MTWKRAVSDPDRLAAVTASGLVGLHADDAFDRLIELATEITGVPRGCITIVDTERTTAISAVGFPDGSELWAPIEHSFCRFVVGSGRPLIVDDANVDARVAGDPAIEAFAAVAWAGYAVEDAEGRVLGTFCLMSESPHEWTPLDLLVLATLSGCASTEIALRSTRTELAASQALVESLKSDLQLDKEFLTDRLNELVGLEGLPVDAGQKLLRWSQMARRPR